MSECRECGKQLVWIDECRDCYARRAWREAGAPLCRADRACVARAHDRNCPTAIAEELRRGAE